MLYQITKVSASGGAPNVGSTITGTSCCNWHKVLAVVLMGTINNANAGGGSGGSGAGGQLEMALWSLLRFQEMVALALETVISLVLQPGEVASGGGGRYGTM